MNTTLTSESCSDIDGSWTYINNWSGTGVSCRYEPSPLTIDQTGGTFTGRLVTSDLIFSFPGEPEGSGASVPITRLGTCVVDVRSRCYQPTQFMAAWPT